MTAEAPHDPGTLAAYEAQARRFNYFRLVYLLERLFPDTPRVGHTGPARDDSPGC